MAAESSPDGLPSLLARLDELRWAERRAACARMVSVAGHLVGTPLNVIAGRAALIRTNSSPEAVEENVRRIEEQVERLALRIRRLIDYFSFAEPAPAMRSIGEVLDECRALYAPIAELRGVALEISANGCEAMRIDDSPTALILTSLLALGARNAPSGQTITLQVSEGRPKTAAFELELPGLPLPPKNLERFEPPEQGVRYDSGALETFWLCLGLVRRAGAVLEVTPSELGSKVRYECALS